MHAQRHLDKKITAQVHARSSLRDHPWVNQVHWAKFRQRVGLPHPPGGQRPPIVDKMLAHLGILVWSVNSQALSTHLPWPVGKAAATAWSRLRQFTIAFQVGPGWAMLGWLGRFDLFATTDSSSNHPVVSQHFELGPLHMLAIAN